MQVLDWAHVREAVFPDVSLRLNGCPSTT